MQVRLGFLASHGGSSARAVHAACMAGDLSAHPAVLVCNNGDAPALAWAREVGLPARHLSGRTHPDPEELDEAIRDTLVEHGVDLVLLSGYLKKLGSRTVAGFRHRILNVHPAPLPEFGGQGMYGLAVHEAVLAAGVTTTAVTVHLVDAEYDQGPVVHRNPLPVGRATDAAALQRRVAEAEPPVVLEAMRRVVSGEVDLDALDGR